MIDLVKLFNFSRREEISALCEKISALIAPILQQRKQTDPPVIINITGDVNSGKSIFWDEIRQRLFEHGGIFIKSKSDSTQEHGRNYETWKGTLKNTTQDCSIFVCNVNALYSNTMSCKGDNNVGFDAMSPLRESNGHNINELGDIIILTNPHPDFLSDSQSTLNISVGFIKTPPTPTWNRDIQITIPPNSLLYNSAETRKLLDLPAP